MGLVGHWVSIKGFEMSQSTAAEKRLWTRWSVCNARRSCKSEVAVKLKNRLLCISCKRKLVNQLFEYRMITVQNCAALVYVTVTARCCSWRGVLHRLSEGHGYSEWLITSESRYFCDWGSNGMGSLYLKHQMPTVLNGALLLAWSSFLRCDTV